MAVGFSLGLNCKPSPPTLIKVLVMNGGLQSEISSRLG